jgi:hypothetical protein
MFVSRGLVGPKLYRNSSIAKGKQVNIPVPSVNNPDASGYALQGRRPVQSYKPLENRNGEN